MNKRVFQRLLDTYGADIGRWPIGDRAAAGQLLDGAADARDAVQRVAALDRLLADCAPMIEAERSERLVARVVSRAAVLAPPMMLPDWVGRWSVNYRLLYGWMFIMGCVANVLVRLSSARAPLDMLFSSNLVVPFGG